jgi:hypothetical protein
MFVESIMIISAAVVPTGGKSAVTPSCPTKQPPMVISRKCPTLPPMIALGAGTPPAAER